MSSVSKGSLTSFFLICVHLVAFGCLVALAKILRTLLTRYKGNENGQDCLVPYFSGNASRFFLFRLMLTVACCQSSILH